MPAARLSERRISFSTAVPRRPGWRATRAVRGVWSASRSASACSTARRTSCRSTTAARSRRVRAAVVIGMPSTSVISSGSRIARWVRMPLRRPSRRGTVTSVRTGSPRRRPQSTAAERWLSTAPEPQAKTAAIHAPERVRRRRPTLYTPWWIGCSRLRSKRCWIAPRPRPNPVSWVRDTTACCLSASSAMRRSGCREEYLTAMSCPIFPSPPMLPSLLVVNDSGPRACNKSATLGPQA